MDQYTLVKETGNWLRNGLDIKQGRYLAHAVKSKQVFVGVFDYIFFILDYLGIKYLVLDLKRIPDSEIKNIPLPTILFTYEEKGSGNYTVTSIQMIKERNIISAGGNGFIVLTDNTSIKDISLLKSIEWYLKYHRLTIEKGILFAIFLSGMNLGIFNLKELFLFIIGVLGLTLSQELVNTQQAEFKKNSLVKRICEGGGEGQSEVGCQKLAQKSSNFLDLFEWSELGVITFWGYSVSILLLGVAGYQNLLLLVTFLVSIVGISFSIFSFYEQIRLRTYCRICSIIMGLFYALFIVNCIGSTEWHFSSGSVNFYVFPTILVLGVFLYAIDEIANRKTHNMLLAKFSYTKGKYMKFASSNRLFEVLNTQRVDEDLEKKISDKAIDMAANESEDSLTIFTNPDCKFCNKALEEITREFIDRDLKIGIILLPTDYAEESGTFFRAARLISINLQFGLEHFLETMKSWHKNRDPIAFEKKLQTEIILQDSFISEGERILKEYIEIGKSLKIGSFPQFLYNDKMISNFYAVEDLKFHI